MKIFYILIISNLTIIFGFATGTIIAGSLDQVVDNDSISKSKTCETQVTAPNSIFFENATLNQTGGLGNAYEKTNRSEDSSTPRKTTAKNVIYGEVCTMLIIGSVSINYERFITEHYWLRIGYGSGYLSDFDRGSENSWGRGPMVMAMYLTEGNHKFEFGLGGSFLYAKYYTPNVNDWWLFPAIAVGYRYQPMDGGVMFRIGLTYDYFMGAPVEFSLGYAF